MEYRLSKEFKIYLIVSFSMSILCATVLLVKDYSIYWIMSFPGTIAFSIFLLLCRVPFRIAETLSDHGPIVWEAAYTSFIYYLILLLPILWLSERTSRVKRRISGLLLAVMLFSNLSYSMSLVTKLWPHGLGERITTESFDGVIINPERYKRRYGSSESTWWKASKEDILKMEDQLAQFVYNDPQLSGSIIGKELEKYKRVYESRLRHGKKWINIRAIHETTEVAKSGHWRNAIFMVSGGGAWYWGTSYNVESNAFSKTWWNGPM